MKVEHIAVSDFQGFNEIKALAKNDEKQALPKVVNQFESIFLQSMLKSIRMEQHFLDESNPFGGKNEATFQEILDGQFANNIADSSKIGLITRLSNPLEGSIVSSNSNDATVESGNIVNTLKLMNNSTPKNSSNATVIDDFVKSIWPKAKQAAALIGLDPKILIAQAALETGWGQFVAKDADGSTSNNLFNVKTGSSKKFETVRVQTTEYIAGTPIKMNEDFRKYPSVEQSFNDYVSLIKSSERYQGALANTGNPELYINELHKAGYASDPEYGSKILSIYHGDELNHALERCAL